MNVTVPIPFDALPARKDADMPETRMTWIVDKPRLIELLAPRYKWQPSLNVICRDAGLSGSRSHPNWSEGAVMAIANHFGLEPTAFAEPRQHNKCGRPQLHKAKPCPRMARIEDDLQEQVLAAATACGMTPQAWIDHVLRACVSFTAGKEPRG